MCASVTLVLSLLPARPALAQPASNGSTEPYVGGALKAPISVANEDLETIAFARLVLRLEQESRIHVSGDALHVLLVDELRRLGYPARGYESVVFAQDKSSQARFEVGGTISELSCTASSPNPMVCGVAVTWELFDRKRNGVVYKVLTRATAAGYSGEQLSQALILGAFRSLLSRPKFVDSLRKRQVQQDTPSKPPLHFMKCESAPVKMPAEADAVLNGVVVIETQEGIGSGVLISADGLVLTAAHVVDTDGEITVFGRVGSPTTAHLVRMSRKYDVALLAPANKRSSACLTTRLTPASIGEDLYAIGSPASRELSFTLTRGIVSATRTIENVPLIQTDASISPGNSGGPLLDSQGRVLGVVDWKVAGKAIEGIAFGVPIDTALQALGLVESAESDPALFAPHRLHQRADLTFVDTPDPLPTHSPTTVGAPSQARTSRGTGMRVAGIVSAGVGLGLIGYTWLSYESHKTNDLRQEKFHSLQTWNTVGWASVVAGGGLILGSFVFYPPHAEARTAGTVRLQVGPGNVSLQGSY